MKKCVVVSDSFKGTLSSLDICQIARQSVPRFFPNCQLLTIPVADGGEGTVDCFLQALQATPITVPATGPHWQPIQATYARSGHRAVIEMASTAGLTMAGAQRNPAQTTTFGVGQLIRHAAEQGCTELLLGLGGSATNDGGCGAAAALGVVFYDHAGQSFVPAGGTLDQIKGIDLSPAKPLLDRLSITVMCDVENPLHGKTGAAHIFGPQKGADTEMVSFLDGQLRSFDLTLQRELGLHLAQLSGSGAAGGMGAGCIAFFGAQLKPGIEAVLDMVQFDRCLQGADLVITGEGRLDTQSLHGKVISGIARRTRPRQIPLLALVGSIAEGAEDAYELGVTAMFGIDREAVAFEAYAHKSAQQYQRTLEDVLRLIQAMGR